VEESGDRSKEIGGSCGRATYCGWYRILELEAMVFLGEEEQGKKLLTSDS